MANELDGRGFPISQLVRRKGGGGHGGGGHSSGGGHASSSSGRGKSSSSSSSSSSTGKGISLSNSGGHSYSTTTSGGGKPYTLPKSTVFAGRQAGGGTRNQIYGSYYYGSGYPYGGYGYWVYSRPLPYGYWPVPIYVHNEYGSNEYGPASNGSRPGGATIAASLTSPDRAQVYRILGDNSSVTSVLQSLASSSCGAIQGTPYAFQPTQFLLNSTSDNSSLPRPEQIIQYYRASSFVLSLDGYNNTMALSSNTPSSNTSAPKVQTATPLPSNINATFLSCLNTTIGYKLPMIQPTSHSLSKDAIGGIVAAAIIGFALLLILINSLHKRRHRISDWFCGPCRRRRKASVYAPIDKQINNEVHAIEAPIAKEVA